MFQTVLFTFSRLKWVNNIQMDLGEIGWGDVDWIGLVEDRD
jgi:hypothetical protein